MEQTQAEKEFQSFKDLVAWQKARAFKMVVYALLPRFPSEEKYELTSQLRRAARSISANISEGYGRYTYKDQHHFCIQARGSLIECQNHFLDAFDCNYISEEELIKYEQEVSAVEKVLNGYISWLRKKMKGE